MDTHNTVQCLTQLLADTYALYLKTQYHHWNIVGSNFFMLHKMLEEQYEHLAEAVDEIAERIRALGAIAPGSFEEFNKLTAIKSAKESSDWVQSIESLYTDHLYLVSSLQQYIRHAETAQDDVSMDLMIQRSAYHQKTAWMLESTIKNS